MSAIELMNRLLRRRRDFPNGMSIWLQRMPARKRQKRRPVTMRRQQMPLLKVRSLWQYQCPNWANNRFLHFSCSSLIVSVIRLTCDPWWSGGYRLSPVQPHWPRHWDRWRSNDCRSYSDSPRSLWASCAGKWNATCRDRSEQTNDTSNWDRRQRNCFPMACCWR